MVKAIAVILIAALLTNVFSPSSPDAAAICCGPTIEVINVSALGPLLLNTVTTEMVNKLKKIVLDKLKLNFLQGTIFQSLLSGSLDSLVENIGNLPGNLAENLASGFADLTGNIEQAVTNMVNQQVQEIAQIASPENISNAINTTLTSATENMVRNALEGKGLKFSPDVSKVVQQYGGFLGKAGVQAYAGNVKAAQASLINGAKVASGEIVSSVAFGAAADLSASVSGKVLTTTNIKDFTEDAKATAASYVNKTVAENFQNVDEAMRGNFVPANTDALTKQLKNAKFCDQDGAKCVRLDDDEVQSIVQQTNNLAVQKMSSTMASVESAVRSRANNSLNQIKNALGNELKSRLGKLTNLFKSNKSSYFANQTEFEEKKKKMQAALEAGTWKSYPVPDGAPDPKNVESVTRLIAQSLDSQRDYTIVVKRETIGAYIAGLRAVKVAEDMEKELKRFNLDAMAKKEDDVALKDYLELRKRTMYMESELAKLKAAVNRVGSAIESPKVITKVYRNKGEGIQELEASKNSGYRNKGEGLQGY